MILIYFVIVLGVYWLDIIVRYMEGVIIGRFDIFFFNFYLFFCIDFEKLE